MIVTRLIVINDFILMARILCVQYIQLTFFFFFLFKKNFLPDLFFFDFTKFSRSCYLFVSKFSINILKIKSTIHISNFVCEN